MKELINQIESVIKDNPDLSNPKKGSYHDGYKSAIINILSLIKDDKLPSFDLTDIIKFGYYVRKNPNVAMSENYFNWKEIDYQK